MLDKNWNGLRPCFVVIPMFVLYNHFEVQVGVSRLRFRLKCCCSLSGLHFSDEFVEFGLHKLVHFLVHALPRP